jgi:selenide,water dikinase
VRQIFATISHQNAGVGYMRRKNPTNVAAAEKPGIATIPSFPRVWTMNAPDRAPLRLTQFSHGGGCGCKIAPGVLRQILAGTGTGWLSPDLLVGIETSDDAAVYRINERQAIVATTDFFMPIVDDPYDFGAIAATNAISDVYAMGATPLFALAIVAMPVDRLPVETIRRIVEGGQAGSPSALPLSGAD